MTHRSGDRQKLISSFWKHGGKTPPAWLRRLEESTRGEPSAQALEERDLRKTLPETREMTGILLGDPPAGRSALDQRRAAEAVRPWWETEGSGR